MSPSNFRFAETTPVERPIRSSPVIAKDTADASTAQFGASSYNAYATMAGQDTQTVPPVPSDEAAREPVLPMTPQSPESRSPAAGVAALAGNAALPARSAVNQDLEVVHELLGTMKLMLGTLGSTFDVLGDQTIKVATLPAAIDAVHQVCVVRCRDAMHSSVEAGRLRRSGSNWTISTRSKRQE